MDYELGVEDALKTCSNQVNRNRQEVIDLLLEGVGRCDPQIHRNAALKLNQKRERERERANIVI